MEKLSAGAWSVMPSPDQGTGYNQLNGVSCVSASSCVAVGFSSVGSQERVLIETLANGSWTLTPSPALAASSSYLESVSCPAPNSCVAVGYEYNGSGRRTLVETLTGGAWAPVSSPNVGSGDNLLDSVSCWSPASCVAVGYYASGKAHLGLVETLGPTAGRLLPSRSRAPLVITRAGSRARPRGLAFSLAATPAALEARCRRPWSNPLASARGHWPLARARTRAETAWPPSHAWPREAAKR